LEKFKAQAHITKAEINCSIVPGLKKVVEPTKSQPFAEATAKVGRGFGLLGRKFSEVETNTIQDEEMARDAEAPKFDEKGV
jgi:hypothetical protein